MKGKYLIFFILNTYFVKYLAAQESKLLFVNLIFRHGDRTPISPYHSDPYGNESYWPNGFGQLTNRGKLQHYELGKWMRKRYAALLPELYSLNDIYIHSTDYDRALMSAQSHLAGLYMPNDTDIWNKEIKWQPIPVHTIPKTDDGMLANNKNCPVYDIELDKVLTSPDIMQIKQEMEPLFKYISNHTNSTINNFSSIVRIYDTLYVQSLYNFKLPDWTKDIFPSQMKRWVDISFKFNSYNIKLQRFRVGLLMNEIMQRFVNKTKNILTPNRKMWIYSAHDGNIANFLMTLGAYNDISPPYTSTIIMELHVRNGKHFVLAFYKNDTVPHPISMLGCELSCPLDKLMSLLKPVMLEPVEWEVECKDLPVPMVLTVVAIVGICLGALLIIILVSLCCCRKYLPARMKFN